MTVEQLTARLKTASASEKKAKAALRSAQAKAKKKTATKGDKTKAETAWRKYQQTSETVTGLKRELSNLRSFIKKAKSYSSPEDKARKGRALPPGKRVSSSGNTYFESRVNRADYSKKGI